MENTFTDVRVSRVKLMTISIHIALHKNVLPPMNFNFRIHSYEDGSVRLWKLQDNTCQVTFR